MRSLAGFGALSLVIHAVLAWSSTVGLEVTSLRPGDLVAGSEIGGCTSLVFLDPECPTCRNLVSGQHDWRGVSGRLKWVLPDTPAARSLVSGSGFDGAVEFSAVLFDTYRIRAVPAALTLEGSRLLASGTVPEALEVLGAACTATDV